ncbi:glycoside hydrolase family 18 protein [Neobacillus niacini]|uniref:glycosyl hydrolase family 18 protein n=1 Tax=Neobacillus niacini TaxID=86668 RepID=UPI0021CB8852|nr:glycoside hydrolase family 18 protein [Neobacillus niacini]MCM3764680.1 glycoside hydrolase family 18 protein [Neobacillus niacini]
MKYRKLLLATVILITFIGGIFTGVLISGNSSNTVKIKQAAKTINKPAEKEKPVIDQSQSKVLIGYVQDFRDPNVVDYDKLTHVIFSFAHPTKDGGMLLNGDSALGNLRKMVANAKKHDTKAILAIGGWYHINGGESYDYFKTAISDPASRSKLVNELASFADREQLDGIDVDFEHPRNEADAQNLAAFVKELSEQLHPKHKEVSVAVYSKIHAVTLTEVGFVQFDPSMFQYVDHVNIMAYDGQWDDGYNAANLSPYPYTEAIVNYWSNLFDTLQITREKLVLGVPLYAQPEDPKIKQVSFAAIIDQNEENAGNDTVSINGTTYHYNGEKTMKMKTKLAIEQGFGGMMLWEAGLDAHGPNSLTASIFETLKDSEKD